MNHEHVAIGNRATVVGATRMAIGKWAQSGQGRVAIGKRATEVTHLGIALAKYLRDQ